MITKKKMIITGLEQNFETEVTSIVFDDSVRTLTGVITMIGYDQEKNDIVFKINDNIVVSAAYSKELDFELKFCCENKTPLSIEMKLGGRIEKENGLWGIVNTFVPE